MIKEEKVKLSRTKKLELNARNNSNSVSCDYYCTFNTSRNNNKLSICTKLLVPRNGRKKLNIYN